MKLNPGAGILACAAVLATACFVRAAEPSDVGTGGQISDNAKKPQRYRIRTRWGDVPVEITIISTNAAAVEPARRAIRMEMLGVEELWEERSRDSLEAELLEEIDKKISSRRYGARYMGLAFRMTDGPAERSKKVLAVRKALYSADASERLDKILVHADAEECAKACRRIGEELFSDFAHFRARVSARLVKAGKKPETLSWNVLGNLIQEDKRNNGGLFFDDDRKEYNRITRTDIFLQMMGLRDSAIPRVATSDPDAVRKDDLKKLSAEIPRLRKTSELVYLIERYGKVASTAKGEELSDFVRIAAAAPEAVTISPKTADLLDMALKYYRRTGGAVDPTMGTVFGRVPLNNRGDPRLKLLLDNLDNPVSDPLVAWIAKRRRILPAQVREILLWDLYHRPLKGPVRDACVIEYLDEMSPEARKKAEAGAKAKKLRLGVNQRGKFVMRDVKCPVTKLFPLVDGKSLQVTTNTAKLAIPGQRISVRFIVCGRLAGRMTKILESKGLTNYFVRIGPVYMAGGYDLGRRRWKLPVPDPRGSGRTAGIVSLPRNGAICVIYAPPYLLERDSEVVPVIDPRTGRPVSRNAVIVTLASEPMAAEAWAYALFPIRNYDAMASGARGYGIECAIARPNTLWTFSEKFLAETEFHPEQMDEAVASPENEARRGINWPGLVCSTNLNPADTVSLPEDKFYIWQQQIRNRRINVSAGGRPLFDWYTVQLFGRKKEAPPPVNKSGPSSEGGGENPGGGGAGE